MRIKGVMKCLIIYLLSMLSIKGPQRVPPFSECSLNACKVTEFIRFLSTVYPMCSQNLLLGGHVIVVFRVTFPLKSAVCFHQQRMCLEFKKNNKNKQKKSLKNLWEWERKKRQPRNYVPNTFLKPVYWWTHWTEWNGLYTGELRQSTL